MRTLLLAIVLTGCVSKIDTPDLSAELAQCKREQSIIAYGCVMKLKEMRNSKCT